MTRPITGPRDARGRPVLVYCQGSGRSDRDAGTCGWCDQLVDADENGRTVEHDKPAPTF
jgi:hypothetical protein